jgi:hypothetical protein
MEILELKRIITDMKKIPYRFTSICEMYQYISKESSRRIIEREGAIKII